MSEIPNKWATIDIAWGDGKKRIYCPDNESLKFHESETEAREYADTEIQGGNKMVAIMEVQAMLVAVAVEFDQIA